jgi:hypothetical protein
MMVIVYTYKGIFTLIQAARKITFMPQFTVVTHLYTLRTKKWVFPIFPLTRLI